MYRWWLLALVAACGGDDDGVPGGPGEDVADVVVTPLEENLGPQRPVAWTVDRPGPSGSWAMAATDGYFHERGGLLERFPPASATAQWKLTLPKFGSDSINLTTLLPTPDGGVIVHGRVGVQEVESQDLGLIAVGPDGQLRWQLEVPLIGIHEAPQYGLLSDGRIAISFLDWKTDVATVAFISAGGVELSRTTIPPIELPGEVVGEGDPLTGHPVIFGMTALTDGGLAATGHYQFLRTIQCGSRSDPKDPINSRCGDDSTVGFVARFAPDGALTWTRRLGDPWIRGVSSSARSPWPRTASSSR